MNLVHIILILAFAFTSLLLQACPPLGNSDLQEVAARVNNIVIADTAIVGHSFPVLIRRAREPMAVGKPAECA
jgi:hypothetical protein